MSDAYAPDLADKTDWQTLTEISIRKLVELLARLGHTEWERVARELSRALLENQNDPNAIRPSKIKTLSRSHSTVERLRSVLSPPATAAALLTAAGDGNWGRALAKAAQCKETARSDETTQFADVESDPRAVIADFTVSRWQVEAFLKSASPTLWKLLTEMPSLAAVEVKKSKGFVDRFPSLQSDAERVAKELRSARGRQPTKEKVTRQLQLEIPGLKDEKPETIERNYRKTW